MRNINFTANISDFYEMEDSVTMMCRLSSGGLVQIRVDMLSERPHNMVHYVLQGTDGSYESTDGYQGIPKIWLRQRNSKQEWEPLENLEKYRENFTRGCHRNRIDLVPMTTDQPYAEALSYYLALRKRGGAPSRK